MQELVHVRGSSLSCRGKREQAKAPAPGAVGSAAHLNLRLLMSPWSLMILRTCSGGMSSLGASTKPNLRLSLYRLAFNCCHFLACAGETVRVAVGGLQLGGTAAERMQAAVVGWAVQHLNGGICNSTEPGSLTDDFV